MPNLKTKTIDLTSKLLKTRDYRIENKLGAEMQKQSKIKTVDILKGLNTASELEPFLYAGSVVCVSDDGCFGHDLKIIADYCQNITHIGGNRFVFPDGSEIQIKQDKKFAVIGNE